MVIRLNNFYLSYDFVVVVVGPASNGCYIIGFNIVSLSHSIQINCIAVESLPRLGLALYGSLWLESQENQA